MMGIQLNLMDNIRSNYMQKQKDLKRSRVQAIDKVKQEREEVVNFWVKRRGRPEELKRDETMRFDARKFVAMSE